MNEKRPYWENYRLETHLSEITHGNIFQNFLKNPLYFLVKIANQVKNNQTKTINK